MRGNPSATSAWATVRSASPWIATGGLWLLAAIVAAGGSLPGALVEMELGNTAVLLALSGVMTTFFCLLEVYPSLAVHVPYLALAGLVSSGLSAIVNPILFVVVAVSLHRPAIWELPGAAMFGELVGFLWLAGLVIYPLGTTLIGTAILRVEGYGDALGYLLLVPLVAWTSLGIPFLIDRTGVQLLGSTIAPLLIALSFLAIGYQRFIGPTSGQPNGPPS